MNKTPESNRVLILMGHRFAATPDGAVWSPLYHRAFFDRYLGVFDRVAVAARVQPVSAAPENWKRVNDERVALLPLPHFHGPFQYFFRAGRVKQAVRNAFEPGDAVIIRTVSLADTLMKKLNALRYPFAAEIIGDPYNNFAYGTDKPLWRLFRYPACFIWRKVCRRADAVAYVTERTLQKRYPPSPTAFTTHYSSIRLPASYFTPGPRTAAEFHRERPTICFVGVMDQMIKASDVLIKAFARCVRKRDGLRLTMIGGGSLLPDMRRLAAELGVLDNITMHGYMKSEEIPAYLDASDLFVLPSRADALPRALIEAMARGLPCIGSNVGGIPELLPPECLVEPGNVESLASRIDELLDSPERLSRLSALNRQKAEEFREDVLTERRTRFYRFIKEKTEERLKTLLD